MSAAPPPRPTLETPDAYVGHDASDGYTGTPLGVAFVGSDGYTAAPHRHPLDDALAWLERFVAPLHTRDLHLLALWAAHTHVVTKLGTTPRLAITSPLPASGKTTCLEHLARLSHSPVHMGAVSTPAMLARIVDVEPRTLLLDEVDRNLRPDREGVADLIAILNAGYKKGGTRPVLVPSKGGDWTVKEMQTYAPVAMAGISPNLPDDTRSRTVNVVLLPDAAGVVEDSDWEVIEDEARTIGDALAAWADSLDVLPTVELPEWARGRTKERWRPLLRVAVAAGGEWPARCQALMTNEHEEAQQDQADGLTREHAHVALVRDIAAAWPSGATSWVTPDMAAAMRVQHPDRWGPNDRYPSGLTEQRLGRILSRDFGLRTERNSDGSRLGYLAEPFSTLCTRLGVPPPGVTVEAVDTAETDTCRRCRAALTEADRLVGAITCTDCEATS